MAVPTLSPLSPEIIPQEFIIMILYNHCAITYEVCEWQQQPVLSVRKCRWHSYWSCIFQVGNQMVKNQLLTQCHHLQDMYNHPSLRKGHKIIRKMRTLSIFSNTLWSLTILTHTWYWCLYSVDIKCTRLRCDRVRRWAGYVCSTNWCTFNAYNLYNIIMVNN